ncbi:hypothetical protein GOBAR_AA11675 [Gossypium barbadense]|uniref:Uncharacterized protein n=1 Tax=Gossypium barbadense TaxID=3634 RepID=A0A2P5Y052_GOSBA|nr:hypothetical protein GOBAR_AA11675 [Gossypium barbadense]
MMPKSVGFSKKRVIPRNPEHFSFTNGTCASSFPFTFSSNSSVLPGGSLLNSSINNTSPRASDSISDSFTGSTMTLPLKESNSSHATVAPTTDYMEFFPQEPSDSGLLQEVIQGFLPKPGSKKQDDSTTTTNCTYHSISSPVNEMTLGQSLSGLKKEPLGFYVDYNNQAVSQQFESFNRTTAMHYANEIPAKHLQVGQDMLDDIFQYPELMSVLAARVQNG